MERRPQLILKKTMKLLSSLFKSLGSKVLFGAAAIIIITVTVCITVSRLIVVEKISTQLEEEMNGYLIQAGSVTSSVGDFWTSRSFDKDYLMKDLEEVGVRNYKDSKFFQTIPVVAAWAAVNESAKESDMEFHIARTNPRGSENVARNKLEREMLDELMSDTSKESTFRIDEESGVIAIARPVIMEQSCMACHGDPANSPTQDGKDVLGFAMENWKPGDRRGVYILSTPIEKIAGPAREVLISSIQWTLPFALGIGALVFYFVRRLNLSISKIVTHLRRGADEVTHAAGEVSNASQTLAEGASEQAASLEETSSSMEEMKFQVNENAGVAKTTSDTAKTAVASADEGKTSMRGLREGVDAAGSSAKELNRAMEEIQESSTSISKIIKTIDEIAFQTNILALNAAVEAARAGEAGAGFAVVADEVRSLAGRAAEAAGETTSIIEQSISRTHNGVEANKAVVDHLESVLERALTVEEGLNAISSGVSDVNSSMFELEQSASQQSSGIDEINKALTEINDVTQSNAASAEEAASASEQMNAQSIELKSLVSDLELLISGERTGNGRTSEAGDSQMGAIDQFRLP